MDESAVEHYEAFTRRLRLQGEERGIWLQAFDTSGIKSTTWMRGIVQRITKPGNLVLETFAWTFSVAKAYMLLPKHKRFIGSGVDTCCVTEAMSKLILLFARDVLNKESDIDGEE